MTFTSGITMNLTTGVTINITSGRKMTFTTGLIMQFIPANALNRYIEYCWWGIVQLGPLPVNACSWWEIIDPTNMIPTGFEFHVDQYVVGPPPRFHVDMIVPQGFNIPAQWGFVLAELKVDSLDPCDHFIVQNPPAWPPDICSWWEVTSPSQWSGVEFHVDQNASGFHIDLVNGTTPPLVPWPYSVTAEQKIDSIEPCDYLATDPTSVPQVCSWWEILYPKQFAGYEFHVDWSNPNGTFHVDNVTPGNISFPTLTPYIIAEKKIDSLQLCTQLEYETNSGYVPQTCDWWEILYPNDLKGYEFHLDAVQPPLVHIDDVFPTPITGIAVPKIIAELKIKTITACDWFKIASPTGWYPDLCSWWRIVAPASWAGVLFHVDSITTSDSSYKFHVDTIGPMPPTPIPPPHNVTAEPFDRMYFKPGYPDYAPSGMPDFDERQGWVYNWSDPIWHIWSHCAPVAIANSLWWLDSRFEPGSVSPPAVSDGFPLVTSYATMPPFFDDHDPSNAPPLIEHLAYMMDTDGRRTPLPHTGTAVNDMQAGLAQYLSWTGVNPLGDVNGDGEVNVTDYNIVVAANNTVPGVIGWNMAADIFPVTTGWPNVGAADNIVNQNDINLVLANMGKKGRFAERTVTAPDFNTIEKEVENCSDVVLCIGFWSFHGGIWERDNYTQQYPNTGRNGHAVTVAGVNSTTLSIAICDPAFDAYERGLISEGRIPVVHMHPAPEPPYNTHNNASLVSQDIYNVTWLNPPLPPCPGGNWTILNYPGAAPGAFAVIEYAVITKPLPGVHDVAVINVKSSKTGCLPVPTVGQNLTVRVNVTVENQGDFAEIFNVTAYATNALSTYQIGKQLVTLSAHTNTTITIVWNTLGFARSNYTLSAIADTVPGEVDTLDNTFPDGTIWVNLIGDVNGDDYVGIDDMFTIATHFAQDPSYPNWNPNCDLNDDDYIGIDDIFTAASHFAEEGP
jgi:hypothetical protein